MKYRTQIWAAAVIVAAACTAPQEAREADAEGEAPVAVEQRLPTIDHVAPARDSVGATPRRFEWTAAEGAERYAIGVWDDVDRMIWRNDDVRGTSVTLPPELKLEFGTYFWSVTALRDDRAIAESGLSAFVVTE